MFSDDLYISEIWVITVQAKRYMAFLFKEHVISEIAKSERLQGKTQKKIQRRDNPRIVGEIHWRIKVKD